MRLDRTLYVLAVIFFLITITSFALLKESVRDLWVVTTAVLGLLSIGLGYYERPKAKTAAVETSAPIVATTSTQSAQTIAEVAEEEKVELAPETSIPISKPTIELTKVKGIGEKRATQLNAFGISTVEELAKTTAEDLAAKLKISAKITEKWIENAKRLAR